MIEELAHPVAEEVSLHTKEPQHEFQQEAVAASQSIQLLQGVLRKDSIFGHTFRLWSKETTHTVILTKQLQSWYTRSKHRNQPQEFIYTLQSNVNDPTCLVLLGIKKKQARFQVSGILTKIDANEVTLKLDTELGETDPCEIRLPIALLGAQLHQQWNFQITLKDNQQAIIEKAYPDKPISCNSFLINLIGLMVSLVSGFLILKYTSLSLVDAQIAIIGSFVLPIFLLENLFLKTSFRSSTGLNFSKPANFNLKRVAIKLWGLYLTVGGISLLYWIFPEYQGDFYNHYYQLVNKLLPWFLILSIPYFLIVDAYMEDPEDGYWVVGRLGIGQWKNINRSKLNQHLLGWLVKAFFLPLMSVFLKNDLDFFRNFDYSTITKDFGKFYSFFYQFMFGVDLLYVTGGYLLTLRILDAHIRWTESTLTGWISALICYQPFWSFFSNTYLPYDRGSLFWTQWLFNKPLALQLWGYAILLLTLIYTLSSIAFGLRFSNLTHRGILTNGPYAFMKHPAYVSKNLTWWLISIPFVAHDGILNSIHRCVLLVLLNLIYALRAYTEEKNLSKDPVYVQYALAMNEKGIFSFVGKLIPVFQYRPPKT
jgi:protein-S-isoprenylcysteine O-methyltransferase Ste14